MPLFEDLSLDELRAHAVGTFRTAGGTRPDVLRVKIGNANAVLKDYSRSDPWFRRLIGPLITYREARALRILHDVRGVPRLIRKVNRRAFLMEYITGTTARKLSAESVTPELFDRLYLLVHEIHQYGIAHCDLRSGGNTIIDSEGRPYFVDFVAHFIRGSRWNLPWRWAFGKFCQADQIAVARLKKRLAPDLLTSKEKRGLELDRNLPLARVARFIGGGIRDINRLVLTKRNGRT